MTTAGQDRLPRLCDVCGQLDTAPRHVTGVEQGGVPPKEFLDSLPDGVPMSALVEILDPTTVVRHMDCCAAQGCLICGQVTQAAGGAQNDELVTFLTSGTVDELGS